MLGKQDGKVALRCRCCSGNMTVVVAQSQIPNPVFGIKRVGQYKANYNSRHSAATPAMSRAAALNPGLTAPLRASIGTGAFSPGVVMAGPVASEMGVGTSTTAGAGAEAAAASAVAGAGAGASTSTLGAGTATASGAGAGAGTVAFTGSEGAGAGAQVFWMYTGEYQLASGKKAAPFFSQRSSHGGSLHSKAVRLVLSVDVEGQMHGGGAAPAQLLTGWLYGDGQHLTVSCPSPVCCPIYQTRK